MPEQNSQQGRRPHFHRGRRGQDRRGTERRTPPPGVQEQTSGREGVDVEQIMRDIRSRISQRHGIDLSAQQIQELAARRLEAILEPRNIKPALMEQLRRGAGEAIEPAAPAAADAGYSFEDTTLFETHRGILRFFRRLLHPILKLFFNPTPLIHALNTQARMNREAAAREAERDRQQAEWNALHYEIVQRLVTEISRVSLEMQGLALRVESLSAKVDFNERRVRGIENVASQGRPARGDRESRNESRSEPRGEPRNNEPRNEPRGDSRGGESRGGEGRTQEPRVAESREAREPREPRVADTRPGETDSVAAPAAADITGTSPPPAAEGSVAADATRRKRRRRRGRRSGGALAESSSVTSADQAAAGDSDEAEGSEGENGETDDIAPVDGTEEAVTATPAVAFDARPPQPVVYPVGERAGGPGSNPTGDPGVLFEPAAAEPAVTPDAPFTPAADSWSHGAGQPALETQVTAPPAHTFDHPELTAASEPPREERPQPSLPPDDPGPTAAPPPDPGPQDR